MDWYLAHLRLDGRAMIIAVSDRQVYVARVYV